jgi:hypothetical protein
MVSVSTETNQKNHRFPYQNLHTILAEALISVGWTISKSARSRQRSPTLAINITLMWVVQAAASLETRSMGCPMGYISALYIPIISPWYPDYGSFIPIFIHSLIDGNCSPIIADNSLHPIKYSRIQKHK